MVLPCCRATRGDQQQDWVSPTELGGQEPPSNAAHINSGYTYPQMQLEDGRVYNMLPTEKATPPTCQRHEHEQNSWAVLHLGQRMGLDVQCPDQHRPPTSIVVRNAPEFALLWVAVPGLNASCNSGTDEATSSSSTSSGDWQHRADPSERFWLQWPENSWAHSWQRGCHNMGRRSRHRDLQQWDRWLPSWQHGHKRWGQKPRRWTWTSPWMIKHRIKSRGETATPLDEWNPTTTQMSATGTTSPESWTVRAAAPINTGWIQPVIFISTDVCYSGRQRLWSTCHFVKCIGISTFRQLIFLLTQQCS